MELCSQGHDEVAFEGRKCPVCSVIDEKDEKILELKEEVEDSERAQKEAESLAEYYKTQWQDSEKEVERLVNGKEDGER